MLRRRPPCSMVALMSDALHSAGPGRVEPARWLVAKMAEGYSVDPKMFAGLYFLAHGEALFGR